MYGIHAGQSQTFAIPAESKPFDPLLSIGMAEKFVFYASGLYYVYALCYPSGLPFYIGAGQDRRCFSHIAESATRSQKWNEKNEIIHQLLDCGGAVWFHFLALVDDRSLAGRIEAHWIRKLGLRKTGGVLANAVKPDGVVDALPVPPQIPGCREEAILKSFRHPVLVVPPPVGPAPRKGKVVTCPACNNEGQVIASMVGAKIACPHCGHFVIAKIIGVTSTADTRVRFGGDELPVNSLS